MPEAVQSNPSVSVILPARDEEANIAAAVESLAAQTVENEIIVVNDGSTDRTGEILAELAARFPQLRVIANRELPAGWVGKNYACHLGAQQARGEWLLFTDADVRHAPDAIEAGLRLAEEHGAKLVSYSPGQEMETWWEEMVIPYIYYRLSCMFPYEQVNDPDSAAVAANGQWLMVSRRAYFLLGGHETVRGEILEDVALARKVKRAGYRIHFSPAKGKARTRMYQDWGSLWQGWTKNLHQLRRGDRSTPRRPRDAGGGPGAGDIALFFLLFFAAEIVAGFFGVGILAALILVVLHLGYRRFLRKSGYPARIAVFYLPAVIIFYALVVSSWFAHRVRGRVVWKGRAYGSEVLGK